MPRFSDVHTIIVAAQNAVLSAYTFTEIFGGTGGCVVNVNGVVVNVPESSNVPIQIRTISGGTGCYLLGENKDVSQGSPTF